jgi:hypothetical protein
MKNCLNCSQPFSPVIEYLAEESLKHLALSYCPQCRVAYSAIKTVDSFPGLSPEAHKALEGLAKGVLFVAGGVLVATLLEALFAGGKKGRRRR